MREGYVMSLFLAAGQKSNEVVALQNALNAALDCGLVLDGIFGSKTQTAVRQFQRRLGLTVDGIAGPKTLSKLFHGVNLLTRVSIVAHDQPSPSDAGPISRDSSSPWDPRLPVPGDQPTMSFGAAGLLKNELFAADNWIESGFPKKDVETIPKQMTPLRLDDRSLRLLGVYALPMRERQSGRGHTGRDGFGVALQFGNEISSYNLADTGMYEMWTGVSVMRPVNDSLVPSLGAKWSPDGKWMVFSKLEVYPYKFNIADWTSGYVQMKLALTGSVLAFPGGMKGKATAGPKIEAKWKRGSFDIFVNVGGGLHLCTNYSEEKGLYNGCAAPYSRPYGFGLGVEWGFRWGKKPKKSH